MKAIFFIVTFLLLTQISNAAHQLNCKTSNPLTQFILVRDRSLDFEKRTLMVDDSTCTFLGHKRYRAICSLKNNTVMVSRDEIYPSILITKRGMLFKLNCDHIGAPEGQEQTQDEDPIHAGNTVSH